MSAKRQATTDLNHDNWDEDDPSQHEGVFKTAPKEELEKRVMRTAKRRSHTGFGEEAKKNVFSGFGGFNKTQSSSFDFLSKLTNGNKNKNESTTETVAPSSLFKTSPLQSSGVFNSPLSNAKNTNINTFGIPSTQSSIFGSPSISSTPTSSLITNTVKSDSTSSESPFKIQTTPTINSTNSAGNSSGTSTATVPQSQTSSSIFGTSFNNANNKSLFSDTKQKANDIPLKTQPEIKSDSAANADSKSTNNSNNDDDDKKNEKKQKYYSKIKGLNKSVSDWIQKHVNETPLCILTPIFKDYEKYLTQLQDEFEGPESSQDKTVANKKTETTKQFVNEKQTETKKNTSDEKSESKEAKSLEIGISPFTTKTTEISSKSIFSSQNTKIVPSISITPASTSSGTGFSFGIKPTSTNAPTTTSSLFTLKTDTTANTNGNAPFSFGTGKPFSFNSNIQKPPETTNEKEEDEDEPPKVEYTPIVEDNSVYDKKCKIFVKKDGSFVDNGVGTLYIKKVEESGKHQLLVRANTSLGNVLLNLILSSGIPLQRMGKNNVMMVCIPNPDAKPPPTPVLIRVKSSEEADNLLETLNKYKS